MINVEIGIEKGIELYYLIQYRCSFYIISIILILFMFVDLFICLEWYMWRCYEPYGCFYIGAPWSGENRPVSMFPARPDSINPHYLLYTRDYIDQPHELKIDHFDTIKSAPFRLENTFYFIIHGFLDNGDDTWVMVSI